MSAFAIRAHNLSKRYRLGAQAAPNQLREVISHSVKGIIRRVSGRRASTEDFSTLSNILWALDDVSFDVHHGESLGIIGSNGARKSTLLKMLCRITEPTSGYAELHGRVGSLLEVGTGFHPELTGRENIFLSGAILGMRRAEIRRSFDEIVDFSEIERFIDTPVKYYSSGMYMRLAFAVAAHLKPEILFVDEVLAVGDVAFQHKCLGKMGDVTRQGRTVIFVSHNMLAIENLCKRAIWLQSGRVAKEGPSKDVIASYLSASIANVTAQHWVDPDVAPGNDDVRLHRASVRGLSAEDVPITVRTPFVVVFEYWNLIPNAYIRLHFKLYNEQELLILEAGPLHDEVWRPLPVGLIRDECHIPGDLLTAGMYRIVLDVVKDKTEYIHHHADILVFEIRDTLDFRGNWYGKWGGLIRPMLDWRTHIVDEASFSLHH